jgi:hypothetical protein
MRADWFESYSNQFIQPAYFIMALLIVVWVGLLALRRFEDAHFERKIWGVPVIVVAIFVWPSIVLGIKSMVDTFNTFLLARIFHIPWHGFGFPEVGSPSNILGWSAEALARLLPNLSYWLIYSFYMIFLFFYSILGPFIIAKGILSDEIEAFIEMVGELTVIIFWQTTLVLIVAFIMPEIVSGTAFPANPRPNFYFLSFILGVMILFVPPMTRKFVVSISSAFMPSGFRWGGAFIGIGLVGKLGGSMLGRMGMAASTRHSVHGFSHHVFEAEEFAARHRHRHHAQHLEHELHEAHHENHKLLHELEHADAHGHDHDHDHTHHDHDHDDHHEDHENQGLWDVAKSAKHEEDHHD